MKYFSEKVIQYCKQLRYTGSKLPKGVRVMNPFQESDGVLDIVEAFYNKYYSDVNPRRIILGINPGRFGGGLTGIPFTDPKRLISECRIPYSGKPTHEPSSEFVYDMINAYGDVSKFYGDFYINSICPLGFTSVSAAGREVNYNYYDSKELMAATLTFIVENMKDQIALGVHTNKCFCLGTGKNENFLIKLNHEFGFFKEIVSLEHPRYVMQYKSKFRNQYIDKYLRAFR